MGNLDLIRKKFSDASIYCASNTHGAYRKALFHIVHAGLGDTYIGQLPENDEVDPVKIEAIAESLTNDYEKALPDREMEKRLWLKLAINCAINPLTAIYQCRNGKLLNDPLKLDHLKRLCDEVDTVLRKKNLETENDSCFSTVKQVAHDTGDNFSSMYQDRKNKKLSEIDFIQGFLTREAKNLGLSVPENEKVFNTIKEIESSY